MSLKHRGKFTTMLRHALGEANHDDVEKRLEELAEDGHIQSAQQKLKDGGVCTVYWR